MFFLTRASVDAGEEMEEWGNLFRLMILSRIAPFGKMVANRRDARSTFLISCQIIFAFYVVLVFLVSSTFAGGHNKHGGGQSLDKLLAAGLIAKALAKGGEEGGGGGGGGHHHFMPIHIPVHSGGGQAQHHHHVHHKYVPIPVKHHTNFIIAHHRVPVPVHVPVPVVKTKVVHVPVEKTKIVPIIVHKGKHTHPHTHESSYPYSSSSSVVKLKKSRLQTSPSSGVSALANSPQDTRKLRITSLGTVRKVKDHSRNGTATAIQFQRPSSRAPEKWIVVVKNKRRQPIRRTAIDSAISDTKVMPRSAVASPSNSTNTTFISPAGPR